MWKNEIRCHGVLYFSKMTAPVYIPSHRPFKVTLTLLHWDLGLCSLPLCQGRPLQIPWPTACTEVTAEAKSKGTIKLPPGSLSLSFPPLLTLVLETQPLHWEEAKTRPYGETATPCAEKQLPSWLAASSDRYVSAWDGSGLQKFLRTQLLWTSNNKQTETSFLGPFWIPHPQNLWVNYMVVLYSKVLD